ncbi:unnamed protein product [Vitrella brassicaformis CCMP3155]|uniref:Uncharacterized protein n=1 Tax=Vitrella brassicaformis (strain CCMP3155) TaxID=1169540 RepID=A0A0G4GQW4_VITBC|nr:unnamed protein product [Vitrella brassicaformis CCMP3155]|eukprot:CEM32842.1 unnamed protein product [Vitrella brassicaformis CCMP3155]
MVKDEKAKEKKKDKDDKKDKDKDKGKKDKDKDKKKEDEKVKRPKGKLTAFWIITSLLGLTGCLMAVISIGLPWRVGEPMSIFTSSKYYTIFGAQGNGYMSWSLVAQQTCDRSKLLGMGGGITQMTCAATGPINEQCNLAFQKHVRDRCTGYRFFGSLSMASCFCCAAIGISIGGGLFTYMVDYYIKLFRTTAVYPYPVPSAGPYLCLGGAAVTLLPIVCAACAELCTQFTMWREQSAKNAERLAAEAKAREDELAKQKEGEAGQAAAMMPPGGMPGAMPGMPPMGKAPPVGRGGPPGGMPPLPPGLSMAGRGAPPKR